MNAEVKKLWVDDLRSGLHLQGKGALRRVGGGETRDCCLGRLCDIYRQTHHGTEWQPIRETYGDVLTGLPVYRNASFLYRDLDLPDEVKHWAGLDENSPSIVHLGRETNLASVNDNGATFAEIADIIQAQL